MDVASPSQPAQVAASFVVLVGLTVAEIIRQGAFYRPDADVVAIVSIVLILVCLLSTRDARTRLVAGAFVSASAWWLFTAVVHHRAASFLPLGASMLGFLAAFLVVRRLGPGLRRAAGEVAAAIGAMSAGVGLVASAVRWYPIAMPSQNLWRLATTLTYSDAAGLLIGMSLLIGLGLDARKPRVRLDVALCVAGLIATQSRGALLAVLIGAFLVPLGAFRAARWSLLAGLGTGLVVVGTSSGSARLPLVLVAVCALLVAGTAARSTPRPATLNPRRMLLVIAGGIAAAILVGLVLHTPLQRRVELASTSDRVAEWRAALHQWHTSFWDGVGPDVLLRVNSSHGTYAYFAHDEYLQIGAGGGLVAELLVLFAAGTVAAAVRRVSALSSASVGALVAFCTAAALDFDWHLAALGLFGGWAAGLACPSGVEDRSVDEHDG